MKAMIVSFLMLFSMTAIADEVLRAGGRYTVKSIVREKGDFFTVVFESETKTGKFDVLRLETAHIHFGIKEGETLRVSAEVINAVKNEAEVGQVLLYLPHVQGYTPVWLLSRKSNSNDLKAARYLDMHAPQSDFTVF